MVSHLRDQRLCHPRGPQGQPRRALPQGLVSGRRRWQGLDGCGQHHSDSDMDLASKMTRLCPQELRRW